MFSILVGDTYQLGVLYYDVYSYIMISILIGDTCLLGALL